MPRLKKTSQSPIFLGPRPQEDDTILYRYCMKICNHTACLVLQEQLLTEVILVQTRTQEYMINKLGKVTQMMWVFKYDEYIPEEAQY